MTVALIAETTGRASSVGWITPVTILIDEALKDYGAFWAAAGHPHAVFPTSFEELVRVTGGRSTIVADD